jgi:hypothetical protein
MTGPDDHHWGRDGANLDLGSVVGVPIYLVRVPWLNDRGGEDQPKSRLTIRSYHRMMFIVNVSPIIILNF